MYIQCEQTKSSICPTAFRLPNSAQLIANTLKIILDCVAIRRRMQKKLVSQSVDGTAAPKVQRQQQCSNRLEAAANPVCAAFSYRLAVRSFNANCGNSLAGFQPCVCFVCILRERQPISGHICCRECMTTNIHANTCFFIRLSQLLVLQVVKCDVATVAARQTMSQAAQQAVSCVAYSCAIKSNQMQIKCNNMPACQQSGGNKNNNATMQPCSSEQQQVKSAASVPLCSCVH